jgi:hypothetical protein
MFWSAFKIICTYVAGRVILQLTTVTKNINEELNTTTEVMLPSSNTETLCLLNLRADIKSFARIGQVRSRALPGSGLAETSRRAFV